MNSGYSTVRNLLYIVLALAALAVASNFYVAARLDRNSQELASLRLLLEKQMTGNALAQAQELQRRMEAINQSAAGIDAKMQQAQEEMDAKLRKAQDDLVARMQVELPKMMDNYIGQRVPRVEKALEQRGVPVPKR